MATLFLMVGLPGAGKTTRARALAEEFGALRLTPDEWMIPLFGESEAGGKRDVLEGRLVWVAMEALRLGTAVILDFGFWGRDERSSLRWLARIVGASPKVVYVPIDKETQLERVQDRWTQTPGQTFPMSEAEVDQWRIQFDVPDAQELSGIDLDDPPAGWATWLDWATERWPSMSQGSGPAPSPCQRNP